MRIPRATAGAALGASLAGLAASAVTTARARRAERAAAVRCGRSTAELEAVAGLAHRRQQILDGSSDLLLVTDATGTVRYASARCQDLLAVPAERLVGRPLADVVDHADRDRVAEVAGRARSERPGERLSVVFSVLLAGGASRAVEADLTTLDAPGGAGGTGGVGGVGGAGGELVWAVRDLGPRHAHGLTVATGATGHDLLTGLPNRAMLVESLDLALARAGRADTRLAAVQVELDRFTATWEDVGHRAAEELVLSAAGRLESAVRPGDLVARTGVDEFTLLLDGYSDPDEVVALTLDALSRLARPVRAGSRSLHLGASAGIALGGGLGTGRSRDLIEQAGAAADHARRVRPGDGVVFRQGMDAAPRRGTDLTADLARAIEAGQVRAAFQPVVQLETGLLCGFEALARWDHPQRGPVSPAVFIPLAEESGLIVDLGRHMLLTACQQVEHWRRQFPDHPVRVGVNASHRQVATRTVVDHVCRALDLSGLPAEHLILEVTESGLHRDLAGVQHVLGQVRDLGVHTAMDDFGTGYSSLAYLRRLPLDIVKIDKSFLDDRDGTGPELLAAVIDLGRRLGLDTVAEGIEDHDQLEAVRSAGCTFGQGYLLSRPLEAEAAAALLGRDTPLLVPAGLPAPLPPPA